MAQVLLGGILIPLDGNQAIDIESRASGDRNRDSY